MSYIFAALLFHAGSDLDLAFRCFELLMKRCKVSTIFDESLSGYTDLINKLKKYLTYLDEEYMEIL